MDIKIEVIFNCSKCKKTEKLKSTVNADYYANARHIIASDLGDGEMQIPDDWIYKDDYDNDYPLYCPKCYKKYLSCEDADNHDNI